MSVKVIVLGTLGDLVKKIAELESVERLSRDRAVQMTAYYKVLESWPVVDVSRTQILVNRFKMQAEHLRLAEAEMHRCLKELPTKVAVDEIGILNTWNAASAARRHEQLKGQLRDTYNELNSLGRHVGTPPVVLEVGDGDIV